MSSSDDIVMESQMKTDGQRAYEGYCKFSKGKSLVSGETLPEWKDQLKEIQSAWEAAAEAVNAVRVIGPDGKEE